MSNLDVKEAFHQVPIAPNKEQEFAFDHIDYNFKTEEVPMDKKKDEFQVPRNIEEAWNYPCKFQRKQWRKAIEKEFKKMEDHKVWKKVKRSIMPKYRRCVKGR